MEISVKLPNSLYQDVSNLAQANKKSVSEFVKNAVRKAVVEESQPLDRPLLHCSDSEVLALANMKMSEAENNRLSELFDNQREENISPLERNELDTLMRVYEVGNLRKAQGIVESVQRGLIKTSDDLA